MILMDLSQAAAKLHCSERWLADNLRSRRFPAKKIGRRWMFTENDISAILQICSVNPTAFPTDTDPCAAPSSSMTKTTARRLQQISHRRSASEPFFGNQKGSTGNVSYRSPDVEEPEQRSESCTITNPFTDCL